ncbi:hypothetical protein I5P86_08290 [Pseudomonas glycinae]|uniref:hypothetical protein n=1 Tax=Pseudomonas TaxID=286 RepID=UPI0018D8389A|nr:MULTISPECIES: hypothetical protein [Pseudomonas]MBH3405046.1 hypothetical protein [Pseudomonas glycinae]MDI3397138.1 hypothetical protein [Pseudomonas sp. V88_4]
MAREEGKKYSNIRFSGYGSRTELDQYFNANYSILQAEVTSEGTDFLVWYADDINGEVYTVKLAPDPDQESSDMGDHMGIVTDSQMWRR